MGRVTTPLSDTQIKKAKPKDRRYKLSDGGGLYLFIYPTGKKSWRVRYREGVAAKEITVGEYPAVGLADARRRAAKVRQAVKDGIDPASLFAAVEDKKHKKEYSFGEVAKDFFALKELEWSAKHYFNQVRRFDIYLSPLSALQIDKITKRDIIETIEAVRFKKTMASRQEERIETARRVFFIVSQIFRYALHRDLLQINPVAGIDLSQVLPNTKGQRLKAITDIEGVRAIFKQLREYSGIATRLALEFLALTALRPGNIRNLKWEWVDLDKRVIVFPKAAMKGRVEYRLPFTERLAAILREIKDYTGKSQFVFCSPVAPRKQLSENTLNYAHKRLGIEEHSAHGWRSSFSTICYEKQREHGFGYEVIESQLAHKIGSDVKLAYLRSDFLEERRELLEWWERFLEDRL